MKLFFFVCQEKFILNIHLNKQQKSFSLNMNIYLDFLQEPVKHKKKSYTMTYYKNNTTCNRKQTNICFLRRDKHTYRKRTFIPTGKSFNNSVGVNIALLDHYLE